MAEVGTAMDFVLTVTTTAISTEEPEAEIHPSLDIRGVMVRESVDITEMLLQD